MASDDLQQQLDGARARITALEIDNGRQRDRVIQLEEMLGLRLNVPIEFGLTGHEAKLIGFLMTREIAPKESILTAVYGHVPLGDMPEIKIIDVFVCKARKKLKPFGVEIETVWGRGYRMSAQTKRAVRAMLAPPALTQPFTEPPPAATQENAA